MRVEQSWSLNSHRTLMLVWPSAWEVNKSGHSTLIHLSCSFYRLHESWTKLVTQLSYNFHARLTECMIVEQNWSLNSHITLIIVWPSAWELNKTSHSTLVQLSCSFYRVHESWTKLVTQLSYNRTVMLVWPLCIRVEQNWSLDSPIQLS